MKLNDSNLFRQQALINGEWLDANNGEVIDVTNPANGDKLGSVPKMGADETRAAIDAANRALPAWRALTAKERANILRNWFNLMMEHQDDLARLMTLEQGKPLAEAKGEISYAASFIEWFAEEGKRIYGDTIPGHQADKRLIVIKQILDNICIYARKRNVTSDPDDDKPKKHKQKFVSDLFRLKRIFYRFKH